MGASKDGYETFSCGEGECSWISSTSLVVFQDVDKEIWIMDVAMVYYAHSRCVCSILVSDKGLNQTNMDNRFAFGLWIYLDLTVIALGAGPFSPDSCFIY